MPIRRMLSNDRISFLTCLALLVILTVGLVVAAFLFNPRDQSYLLATFTEEHVRMLGMFDNRGQQSAYRILLVLVGMLAIAAWYFRPYPVMVSAPDWLHGVLQRIGRYSGILLVAVLIGVALIHYKLQPGSSLGFQGRYGIGFLPSGGIQLALMVFGAMAVHLALSSYKLASGNRARIIGMLVVTAVAVYASSAFLYGILTQPDFRDFTPGLLTGVEWHYAGSVASADRLAFGDRIGEISIHAGLLPSALMGYWQTAFGALDFGGRIRFIACLQLLFFLAAVAAYAKWYSGRWLPVVIAVLLVLPWVAPVHAAVLYPNQSAWRFLGLGIGTLALVYLHARPMRAIAAPLGFTAGLTLLWNLETGLAIGLTYVGFLIVRASSDPGDAKPAWIFVRFVLGLTAAMLAFFSMIRVAFGYWADPVEVIKSFPLLGVFAKGYGGLALGQIDPLAALIFIHALYVLIRGVFRWGSGAPMSPRKACEMALAGLILVWGAYYIKAPHFWNLWSYMFLYGFLLGTLLSSRWPRKPWRFAYFGRSARLVALAMIILPAVITANLPTARSLNLAVRQAPCINENLVSGLCLPGEVARAVSLKADALRRLNAQQPLLFLSANSYLMPLLTGINQPLRMRDAFSETILKDDFDSLVQNILSVKPARILFDDPASSSSGYPAHRAFYRRVRAAIARDYVHESTADGWEVLRSRTSPKADR